NCYIQSFDELNNSAISENTTFLLDWAPEINIHDVPSVMKGSDDFILNVSISDVDGLATINLTSVSAYYKIGDAVNWSILSLYHVEDFANNALFNGTLPGSILEDQETSLFLMVNASDEVDGQIGRKGTSGLITIILDSLNPRLDDLTLDSDSAVMDTINITSSSSIVNITAIFDDPSGINNVNIFYSPLVDLNYIKQAMTNITDISAISETSTFFISLAPTNETGVIAFFFETTDFLNNKGNTSVNYYYTDGSPPQVEDILIPSYITNFTDVSIFFNVSDYTEVRQSVFWYTFDSGQTWTNTVSNPINYTDEIDYSEVFNQTELPFLIKDASSSQMSLDVSRRGGVDKATLTIKFNHDKSTDLRIWLLVNSQDQFLIFDREVANYGVTLKIDLLDLGLTQSDFDDATFTLLFQDFLLEYSGFLTAFSVKLVHYSAPTGYVYSAIIRASIIDSNVQFFITLTDLFWNDINSSTYSYYSDGINPNIEVIEQVSQDLEGSNFITVTASVTDQNGIFGVEIYSRFVDTDEWIIGTMILGDLSDSYYFEIPLDTKSGILHYYMKAYDNSGLFTESEVFDFAFENGLGPIISFVNLPYPNPLDLETKDNLMITVNVSDVDGTIVGESVTIYYKFSSPDEWNTFIMSYDVESGFYIYNVEIETQNGTLFIKIKASDDSDLNTTTDEIFINFINGPSDDDEATGGIEPIVVIIALGSIISVGAATIFVVNKKLKANKVSQISTSNLPSPPESQGPPE
ncbi:MAG: hypothetical protein KAT16_02405, partial [Candidatus Heimdallarchaeota archaeon]|nr:hypothetical protein [Candidatus Heimdallarchaeota archaeon]